MPFKRGCFCIIRNASSIADGRCVEQVLVAHVEQLVDGLEFGVERLPASVAAGYRPRVQVLQQDDVRLAHALAAR